MGEKRAGKRERLFLHPACILAIFLLLTGCALTSDLQKRWQGYGHLETAEELMIRGDYGKALKEYEEVFRLFPCVSPGDSAIFNMGLIWAHPDNPKRDYKRSAMYFRQLVHDFPDSRLREKGRIWLFTIGELINCESGIKTLEKSVDCLKKKLEENQKMIDTLKKIDIRIEEKKRERLPR